MMWTSLAEVLRTAIQSIALDVSDPLFLVEWARGRIGFVSPTVQAGIYLRVTSSRETMTETRTVIEPSSITCTLHGMRDFTLNVQCKSDNHEYSKWAFEYAERIRTRIQRESVRATLLAANACYVGSSAITDLEEIVDGHELSVANLDLFMRAGFEDAAEQITDWIEKIELTSHIKDPAGVEFPEPPNVFAEVIPPP